MVRREGRRGVFGRGTLVTAAAVIALLAALAIPGCGSGTKDEASSFAALFDAKTACVVLEWIPAAPAEEAEETIVEPCQRAVEMAVLAMGNGGRTAKDAGADEAADAEASRAVRESIGRIVGLLAAGKLFEGPVRYGAMIAPPAEDDMVLPSGADLLVGAPTKEGAEALGQLLDALATRYPDAVRPVDDASPREWILEFPAFRGEARVRLAPGELRAAFGGGSLAGERDRLLAGTPAAHPLDDVLPGKQVTSAEGGMRLWIHPEAMAEPLSETVRRALADTQVPPALAANPMASGAVSVLKGAAPDAVRELLASFREIRLHREGFRGVQEILLGEQPSPVIRLFHDREGTVSAGDLAGVPEESMQAVAAVLPPVDELVTSLVRSITPETAPMVEAQLDQPFPPAGGLTMRKFLASLGPRVVFWRRAVKIEIPGTNETAPVLGTGFSLELRDRGPIDTLLRAAPRGLFGVPPRQEGDVTTWDLTRVGLSVTRGILALAPDRLVLASDRETLDTVLAREDGLAANERFAALVERLAGGRPVGAIAWTNEAAAEDLLGDAKETMSSSAAGTLPLEMRAFTEDLSSCIEGMIGRVGGDVRLVSVGTRTDEGFRSEWDILPGEEK